MDALPSVVINSTPELSSHVIDMNNYESKAHKKVIKLHSFWWDKIILTMIVLLVGVTGAQTIGTYLQRSTVKCFVSAKDFSESVQSYIDELCASDLPNYGIYLQIAIYAEVSLLSGLQAFWIVICNGQHESFKSAVSAMNLERNTTTGQYEARDLETVRYLERKLGTPMLFTVYILFKLVFQFVICIAGISLSFLHQLQYSDGIVFKCTNATLTSKQQWPLGNPEIYCSYSELLSILYLRWFNFASLTAIMIAIVSGAAYLCFNRYWLDYKMVARFMRHTGLRRKHYVVAKTQCCCCCYPFLCSCKDKKNISYDMMFQLLRLYGTNYRTAGALFSILIENHLEYITEENCNRSKQKKKKHQLAKKISEIVKQYCPKSGRSGREDDKKRYCVLVTHENDSLVYHLDTQIFGSIVCFNFNPHITELNKNLTLCKRERLHSKVPHIFQIPAHFWLWNRTKSEACDQAKSQIQKEIGSLHEIDPQNNESECTIVYIFAPISEEFYSVYHTECRVKNFLRTARKRSTPASKTFTILIYPKRIANNDVTDTFCGNETWWLESGKPGITNRYWDSKRPLQVKGVVYHFVVHTDNENVNFEEEGFLKLRDISEQTQSPEYDLEKTYLV